MNLFLIAALLATPRLPHAKQTPPASAQPQLSDAEVADRVDTYLSGIDRPVNSEAWKALGPRAADVLEPIIQDAKAFPSKRARALEGLVWAAPARAAQLVGPLARDEKQPAVVRVAALRGAPQVLPVSKAQAELKTAMQSAHSAGMRGAAADELSKTKGGCAPVRAQLAREREEGRAAFGRAMQRCAE